MTLGKGSLRAATVIDRAARWVGAALVAGFAAMVVYVVISRYLFSSTPRWAEELPRMALVWLTFVGTISGFVRGSHFRAGLLDRCPRYCAEHLLFWRGWRVLLFLWCSSGPVGS